MCVRVYICVCPCRCMYGFLHVFPSVMNTCLCVLRYSCVSSLVFFLSPVRSFLPHFFFLSFLLVSRSLTPSSFSLPFSPSTCFTSFLSQFLTFSRFTLSYSLSLSFTLSFSFHLTDSKNLFQEKFSFSILVRCPRCSRSFRNEKRLVGHAWKNTWKDWWKNYRGAPVEWWWKRKDDNQTRIALKFKRFSRSSIDILARSISPFFSFFCPSLHTLSALSSFIILTVLSLHLLSLSRIRSVSLAPPLSLLSWIASGNASRWDAVGGKTLKEKTYRVISRIVSYVFCVYKSRCNV